MSLGKIGTTITKEVMAWTKFSNKSLLAIKSVKINTAGLKLAPELESDVVQLSQQANRWNKHPNEYIPNCNLPNSQIASHHMIDGKNSSIRDVGDLKKGLIDECEMLGGYQAIKVDKEFAQLAPLEKDCIGYRIVGRQNNPYKDIPFRVIDNAKVGDTVILDEGCAYAFQQENLISLNNYNLQNPMLEIIRIPKGARVSRNMEHGGEILMPRGAEYKLISKDKTSDGKIKVVLEYLLPNSKYPNDLEQIRKVAQQHVNSTDDFTRKYAQKILIEMQNL
ncbi:hypothetical protein HDR58_04515 [bacterium]|nr:hypothetical protein [bacterium]